MPIKTPDARYIVVRGRLWRAADPDLAQASRERLVAQLMDARRAVRDGKRQGQTNLVADARRRVDEAKRGLGERGPVWWSDGAPDYHRYLVKNTPYAAWYESLPDDARVGS